MTTITTMTTSAARLETAIAAVLTDLESIRQQARACDAPPLALRIRNAQLCIEQLRDAWRGVCAMTDRTARGQWAAPLGAQGQDSPASMAAAPRQAVAKAIEKTIEKTMDGRTAS